MKSTAGITYDGTRAPSFHDVMAPDDKIMFVQTLSKNWAMTGFRVGWLEAPRALGPAIENLVQFTTSGVPVFTQRAAIAALTEGEAFLENQIERWRRSRDILCEGLRATGRVRFFEPEAAFYLFCAVDGFEDSASAGVPPDRRSGRRPRAWRRLRPRRRRTSASLLRPRPGRDRRSDPAHGALAEGVISPATCSFPLRHKFNVAVRNALWRCSKQASKYSRSGQEIVHACSPASQRPLYARLQRQGFGQGGDASRRRVHPRSRGLGRARRQGNRARAGHRGGQRRLRRAGNRHPGQRTAYAVGHGRSHRRRRGRA